MQRCGANQNGNSLLELLVAITVTSLAIAVSTGFLSGTRRTVTQQELLNEASMNLRSVLDTLIRDVRLAGACLPVTGDFVALDGADGGDEDKIWVRTGLVRPDLSCIRTATTSPITSSTTAIPVESVDGFSVGTRAYIRNTSGTGEYFTVIGVDSSNNRLSKAATPLSAGYPAGSGIYAVDERGYSINHWAAPWGDTPELMLQVGDQSPQPFAVGVERLNFRYQLRRNCPPCDVVDLPATEDEWRLVEQVIAEVRVRSDRTDPAGNFLRREAVVNIKPRNLLPP
ncbi:MAG: hypothetical protein KatS3mg077_0113 [Candidatus Binatia bacterium]|nr:MAG: hypothetical protein KatS3mg077_0113 [Candidatus Binatia bacterium]